MSLMNIKQKYIFIDDWMIHVVPMKKNQCQNKELLNHYPTFYYLDALKYYKTETQHFISFM